ncbi:Ubiquitin-conjugating enzyme E2 J1 [Entomortierella chlamydospora]|uniref:Ubiquitin-conjugating enzyme E2 J1 n=1 Tax=Entomortierella chlamydospora TaxID=101097 RepID=A0A9P6N020_9FUNG|nr:Ubiquitin-conjugating enzyme E2 J1 [Entomortierella chlamydospora]KAG0020218.1 Ubiquitin-conjugating enzyme E2 J1 [Entomortierella chlamydospora]
MASFQSIPAQYNKKSSAVKRIMQEARELVREPSTDFAANPLETDIFEWHFTIRGPEETDFEGGLYHGRILLPNNYPFAPPSLMFLTPNGRFELHKKVCLSITGYHPEYWQPAWGIRTVLVAVMGFLPTQSKGAIGGLDTSVEARKALAIKSKTWVCTTCQTENIAILPDVAPEDVVKASLKADEMPPEFSFGYEADKKKQQSTEGDSKDSDSNRDNEVIKDRDQESSPTATADTLLSTTPNVDGGHSDDADSKLKDTQTQSSPLSSVPATISSSHQHLHNNNNVSGSTSSTTSSSTPNSSISTSPIAGVRPRTEVQQRQQQQLQTQAQPLTLRRRVESSIPMWLDALILGLASILVAMLIRRFL